ncbi:FecR family protein [Sinomicrobium sp. M5D2P17]
MEDIIIKYFNNTITETELEILSKWLSENKKNELYFKELIKDGYLTDIWIQDKPQPDALAEILSRINKPKAKSRSLRLFPQLLKYAAIAVIALGISYALLLYSPEEKLQYEPAPVTLKLGDGTIKELRSNDSTKIIDRHGDLVINQQNDRLDYNMENRNTAGELVFNELTVPKGRRFNILLADGTEVFLNSESTLRFPVSFEGEKQRQVYLKGEGYFSVAGNKEKPFLVNAEEMVVEVLGTRFNVRAYENDGCIKTSLQEGSVQVSGKDSEEIPVTIAPGEAAFFNSKKGTISVNKIIIENDVAWTENRLVFIQEPFSEVIKKIERSYGVRIINENKELENVRFYGDFDIQNESVEDVLKAFTTIKFFEYSLKDDLVTIKK